MRGLFLARAILMSYIYFLLNFVNLTRAFYKLSNLDNGYQLLLICHICVKEKLVFYTSYSKYLYEQLTLNSFKFDK